MFIQTLLAQRAGAKSIRRHAPINNRFVASDFERNYLSPSSIQEVVGMNDDENSISPVQTYTTGAIATRNRFNRNTLQHSQSMIEFYDLELYRDIDTPVFKARSSVTNLTRSGSQISRTMFQRSDSLEDLNKSLRMRPISLRSVGQLEEQHVSENEQHISVPSYYPTHSASSFTRHSTNHLRTINSRYAMKDSDTLENTYTNSGSKNYNSQQLSKHSLFSQNFDTPIHNYYPERHNQNNSLLLQSVKTRCESQQTDTSNKMSDNGHKKHQAGCGRYINTFQTLPTLPDSANIGHMLYQLFTQPTSKIGIIINVIILLTILVSCVTVCVSSLPQYRVRRLGSENLPEFLAIEWTVVSIFTVEYIVRLFSCVAVPSSVFKSSVKKNFNIFRGPQMQGHAKQSFVTARSTDSNCVVDPTSTTATTFSEENPIRATSRRKFTETKTISEESCIVPNIPWYKKIMTFFVDPMNIVDLVAIVPAIVELLVAGSGSTFSALRILRLSRLFRAIRLTQGSRGIDVLVKSLKQTKAALMMLLFFILVGALFFGTLIFFAEEGTYDPETGHWMRPDITGTAQEISPFSSIPMSFWWVVTTATTVGYGDLVPTTALGRIIGSLNMLCGVLVIALPISIIGSAFSEEYEKMLSKKRNNQESSQSAPELQSNQAYQELLTELATIKEAMFQQHKTIERLVQLHEEQTISHK